MQTNHVAIKSALPRPLVIAMVMTLATAPLVAQLVDRTVTPNRANAGIGRSLAEQVGVGRGDIFTPDSSRFLIRRDPFRAIQRGRMLFQRKFTRAQFQGPLIDDGAGDLERVADLGAGLTDSCAACHGRPKGSAGAGGNVATRPDSRDAPHLFGLGLQEMLADEITTDLRATRDQALLQAQNSGRAARLPLRSKGINFGAIRALPNGGLDTSEVDGIDPDLRVRPFFAQGALASIREFIVGAFGAEMGLDVIDPDLAVASAGGRVVTPSGMVLNGALDRIKAPRDTAANEVDPAVVDYLEFYLLNYLKPATYRESGREQLGRRVLEDIGCARCHVPTLVIDHDRRVADVETHFDQRRGGFNRLFANASTLFVALPSGEKVPAGGRFVVRGIFTDFKRHDLGPAFHEVNYDGTLQKTFVTEPLWGVGTTAPYGHDGRSINLREVILRHGGEAQAERDAFASLPEALQESVLTFLGSLVLFPPADTPSNLDPGDPATPGYPQFGHGSVKLSVLFNDPDIVE